MSDVLPGDDAVDRLLRSTAAHLRSLTAGGPVAGSPPRRSRRAYRMLAVAATLVVALVVTGVVVLGHDPARVTTRRPSSTGSAALGAGAAYFNLAASDVPAGFRELPESPFVDRVPEAYRELPTRADLYRTASGGRAVVVTGPHDVLEFLLGEEPDPATPTTAVSSTEVAQAFRLPNGGTAVGIRGVDRWNWSVVVTSTDATTAELLALAEAASEDPADRPGRLLESEEGGSAAAIGSALPSISVRYVDGDGGRAFSITTFHGRASRPILEALLGDHRVVDVDSSDALVFEDPDGVTAVVWTPEPDLLVWLTGAPGMPRDEVVRLARRTAPTRSSGPAGG